jgi:hypothetical protein
LTAITLIHAAFSLVGIVSGFVVISGLLKAKRLDGWTTLFLTTTLLTSATGFLLPFHKLMPSHIVGTISLLILALAMVARYRLNLNGVWRSVFVISAVTAQWFNVFVLVAQLFAKVPALKATAPTQSEPPFAIAQLAVLALFIWLGIGSVKNFQVKTAPAAVGSPPGANDPLADVPLPQRRASQR